MFFWDIYMQPASYWHYLQLIYANILLIQNIFLTKILPDIREGFSYTKYQLIENYYDN